MTIALFMLPMASRAQPPESPQELQDLLTFRDEHLSIREVRTVIPGHVTVLGEGWGWGPRPWRGYTWTQSDVVRSPPEVFHSWTVYRGPERMTVPEYLEAAHRPGDADQMQRRIERNAGVAKAFGGLAVTGLAVAIGGAVGTLVDAPERQWQWLGTSLGGFGVAAVSGVASGAGRARASKLAHDFPATQDLANVQEEVRDYNEELRDELGLTPGQAYRELEPRRPGS